MLASKRYRKTSSRTARKNSIKRFFSLFFKIGLPIIILVGLVFILRADFLQVKNFEIVGTETIQPENIKNIASNFISGNRFFLIPKSNILFLNKGSLVSLLLSKFSRLEKVDINKNFLSKSVELKITERKADLLWCSLRGECFFMTKDGLVFEKSGFTDSEFLISSINRTEPIDKIIFRGILDENPMMKNFATPAKLQNYLKLIEVLKAAGFEVVSVNIESSDRAVAKSNVGDIIFNPEEANLSLTAQNVILLINEVKSKNPSAGFNYIDARFDNKMFYKLY
jgi:hypothetical protein